MQSDAAASAVTDYFRFIAEYSRDLMTRLPIAPAMEPLAVTFHRLKPVFDQWRPAELARLRRHPRPAPAPEDAAAGPAGMNTVGILADRLTILVCKEWYLHHRQGKREEAREVQLRQIPDIVLCLGHARPGHARLLEKVSNIQADVAAGSFEEAYYGLLAANVLMWETQEMLYLKDMESVPLEELRDYIRFFSLANMARNECIRASEALYWTAA